MNSGKKIDRLVQGQTPSLIDTDKGNEVIDRVNSLLNIKVEEGDENEISYSDEDVYLTIASATSGYTGIIMFFTDDPSSGAVIPHTLTFEDGLLKEYTDVS